MASNNRPRSIDGSIGSKIRIILGKTGNNWLLVFDHDDGNRKWQEHKWSDYGVPNSLCKQMNNCTTKGRYVDDVDFGPNDGWYVHGIKRDGSGGHSWYGGAAATKSVIAETISSSHRVQVSFGSAVANTTLETYAILQGRNGYRLSYSIDADLESRMERIHTRNKSINFIRLFANGGYFISDDEGSEWKSLGEHCAKEVEKRGKNEDVAVAADGTWVVIRPDRYIASTGVDSDLSRHLTKFYNDQRERNNRRSREIQEYYARIQREETREQEEREEQERALEAAALERQREADEAAAALIAAQERHLREAAEREVIEQASSSRLESVLEERIIEEVKDISELEERLKKKKRSLQASIDQIPPRSRARIDDAGYDLSEVGNNSSTAATTTTTSSNAASSPATANCVICQVAPSSQAIIPCGHCCLCDDCATTLTGGPLESQLCPLCRTRIQSCLKIFLSTG